MKLNSMKNPPLKTDHQSLEAEIEELTIKLYYRGLYDGCDLINGKSDKLYGNTEERKKYEEENIAQVTQAILSLIHARDKRIVPEKINIGYKFEKYREYDQVEIFKIMNKQNIYYGFNKAIDQMLQNIKKEL